MGDNASLPYAMDGHDEATEKAARTVNYSDFALLLLTLPRWLPDRVNRSYRRPAWVTHSSKARALPWPFGRVTAASRWYQSRIALSLIRSTLAVLQQSGFDVWPWKETSTGWQPAALVSAMTSWRAIDDRCSRMPEVFVKGCQGQSPITLSLHPGYAG